MELKKTCCTTTKQVTKQKKIIESVSKIGENIGIAFQEVAYVSEKKQLIRENPNQENIQYVITKN